ncbi:MAG: dienelactone hydrolase family protein [Armatimonadetes bacterium]|nr:dienelactone hydrolase family protein [Armatimonadota bacterium]
MIITRHASIIVLAFLAASALAAEPDDAVIPPVVERITFSAAGENAPALEGELCIPLRATAEVTVPGVVICHPHPRYGGTMDNPVVIDIRDHLLELGIAVLRFNFRGVGASAGECGGGVAEVNDVLGAMAVLRARPEVQAGRCGLAGYSFGASMALKAAAELGDVTACGLAAFPTEVEGDGMGDLDYLSQVECPLIFVTGTEDIYSHVTSLTRLVTDHRLQADVVPIEGATHFFADAHRRRLTARTIADFMAKHLTGEP